MKHIIILCFVILCCCGTLFSQDAHKGKEFYMAVIHAGYEGVFIISSDTVTKGTILLYRGGTWADTIPFTIQTPHQPTLIKFDPDRYELHGASSGNPNAFMHNLQPIKRSVYIRAEHDIQVSYKIGGLGAAPETSLIYPVQSYGKEYIVIAPQAHYFSKLENNTLNQQYDYSSCAIVATENNTSIKIESPVNLIGASERTLTATLQKGESYLIQARPSPNDTAPDMTGMRISSSLPIAVHTGGFYGFGQHPTKKRFIPQYVSETLLPVSAYAQRYIVIDPVKSRKEQDLGPNYHKIVAMTDTATIYVNGNNMGRIKKGEYMFLPLDNYSVVYGTSPIAVVLFRRSSFVTDPFDNTAELDTYGSPFMTDIAPQEYWQKSYDVMIADFF
jgi:hypothetical protein